MTDALREQAQQYRWEQGNRYGGVKQAVVETAKYNSFVMSLARREPRYIPSRLEKYLTKRGWDRRREVLTGASSRGPVTVRLMGVRIRGDQAFTVACVDQHKQEMRSAGATKTQDWNPIDDGYEGESLTFKRSNRSPTGWVLEPGAYLGQDVLQPPRECTAQIFKLPAALAESGPIKPPA